MILNFYYSIIYNTENILYSQHSTHLLLHESCRSHPYSEALFLKAKTHPTELVSYDTQPKKPQPLQ
jgi:hypothetical protein